MYGPTWEMVMPLHFTSHSFCNIKYNFFDHIYVSFNAKGKFGPKLLIYYLYFCPKIGLSGRLEGTFLLKRHLSQKTALITNSENIFNLTS